MSRQAQFPKERGIGSKLTGYLVRFILRSQTCGPSCIFSLLPNEKKKGNSLLSTTRKSNSGWKKRKTGIRQAVHTSLRELVVREKGPPIPETADAMNRASSESRRRGQSATKQILPTRKRNIFLVLERGTVWSLFEGIYISMSKIVWPSFSISVAFSIICHENLFLNNLFSF